LSSIFPFGLIKIPNRRPEMRKYTKEKEKEKKKKKKEKKKRTREAPKL